MSKRILLHIGRHKSGTTSLQTFFSLNRRALIERGIYYPETGVRNFGHHLIAEPFPMRRIGKLRARYSPLQNSLVQALRDEIDSAPVGTILISSEAFQNMAPEVAASLFSGYDVHVIAYVRDQLSYLVSSYAQEVHADNNFTYTLEDYYRKVFSGAVDYMKFLSKWELHFAGNVSVKLFETATMKNNSVVDDFCWNFLNIDVSEGFQSPEASNPSIKGDLIEYKRILNYFLPTELARKTRNKLYSRLPEFNQRFTDSQLFVTPTLMRLLQIDIGTSNQKLAKKYLQGVDLSGRIQQNSKKHSHCAELNAPAFYNLIDELLPLVPGLDDILQANLSTAEAERRIAEQNSWRRHRSRISLWQRFRLFARPLRRFVGI
ncbi:hypothetical protein QWI17_06515 [Gilvimarinus sp. SDUM040013]|uniref:Sulfotransferase domain-containing protein n=1 Tax=Gilvimarinus gilvus TaxID=3058038 RepID=A0ABU4S5U6_9GAMM|nr:hypothetical protein [Gilvimarinus sp. SDUM040013]MDO3385492.1 hypothetical protein [Gilvimarinus sp. SDUM040013]MDX6851273.1 hypothetical protein [Gilvimarinus sp. SDUM040013]